MNVLGHWTDDPKIAEAIETLGGLVSRAGGEGDEALDVVKDAVAEAITTRGAVDRVCVLESALLMACEDGWPDGSTSPRCTSRRRAPTDGGQ
jgi:hypothetical protein